jgi:hypothetical protein
MSDDRVSLSELEEGRPINDKNGEKTFSDTNLEQLMKKDEWKKISAALKNTFLYFYFHPEKNKRSYFRNLLREPKEFDKFWKLESSHYVDYYENKKYENRIIFPTYFFSLLCFSGGIYGAITGISLFGVGLIIASPFIYRKFRAKKIILEREQVLRELNIPDIKYLNQD